MDSLWRLYVAVKWVFNGSGSSVSLVVWRIRLTNAYRQLNRRIYFYDNLKLSTKKMHDEQNALESLIYEMSGFYLAPGC